MLRSIEITAFGKGTWEHGNQQNSSNSKGKVTCKSLWLANSSKGDYHNNILFKLFTS